MYDPKLYIVSLTITTGIVPQVFEVLEVRASPPPLFWNLLQNIYRIHTCFNAGLFRPMQYI